MKVIHTSTAALVLIAVTLSLALSGCGISDQILRQAQETRDTIDRRARDLEASQKERKGIWFIVYSPSCTPQKYVKKFLNLGQTLEFLKVFHWN